jgi:hypothetical protein
MKRLLAVLLSLGFLFAGVGQAQAFGTPGVNVWNNDGTQSFRAQLSTNDYQVYLVSWRVNTLKVWNIPPSAGHADTLTNVVWHWTNVDGDGRSFSFGSVADGGTDTYASSIEIAWGKTIWVEVHDSYANTCQRVFFNQNDGVSVTTC